MTCLHLILCQHFYQTPSPPRNPFLCSRSSKTRRNKSLCNGYLESFLGITTLQLLYSTTLQGQTIYTNESLPPRTQHTFHNNQFANAINISFIPTPHLRRAIRKLMIWESPSLENKDFPPLRASANARPSKSSKHQASEESGYKKHRKEILVDIITLSRAYESWKVSRCTKREGKT